MPFKSEAQRRWMHANHPAMAKRWEAHTPKGKKLPKKKRPTSNIRRIQRIDPTRTITLRTSYAHEWVKRLNRLKGEIVKLIVDRDVFGFRTDARAVQNVFCPTGVGGGVDPHCSPSVATISMADKLRQKGGFTFVTSQRKYQDIGQKGYAVSPYPKRSAIINGKVSRDHIKSFMKKNSDLLAKPNHAVGAWRDPETKKTYLDVSIVTRSRKDAITLGRRFNQISIFDFEHGKTINTGGTGQAQNNFDWLGRNGRGDRQSIRRVEQVANTDWRFYDAPQQAQAFLDWLQTRIAQTVLSRAEQAIIQRFVGQAYVRGISRAREDVEGYDVRGMRREQFARDVLKRAPSKIQLLIARNRRDVESVIEQMRVKLQRTLTDALLRRSRASEIAKLLNADIDDTAIRRLRAVAHDGIVRAHAEGQLEGYEAQGITEVVVMVEWLTAGDEKVCPACEDLEGIVVSVQMAHGMLPRHVGCRCAFGVAGRYQKGQKRSPRRVGAAIERSLTESPWGWNYAPLLAVINESPCGAGEEGSPGFQPGNDCAEGDGAKEEDPLKKKSERLAKEAEALIEEGIKNKEGVEMEGDWENLGESEKDEAEQQWMNDNLDEYVEKAKEEYLEELEQSERSDAEENSDLAKEAFEEWAAKQEGFKEEWKDAFKRARAGEIEYDWDKGGDEFANYMTKERELAVDRAFGRKINDHVDSKVDEARQSDSLPDHIFDFAQEEASNAWHNLSDDEKYKSAEDSGGGVGFIRLQKPDTFKLTKNGRDYERTRGLVLYAQEKLQNKLAKERGLGDVQFDDVPRTMWGEWKKSSTSDHGLLLQHATALELNGFEKKYSRNEELSIRDAAAGLAKMAGVHEDTDRDEAIKKGIEIAKIHVAATWGATQYAMKKAGVDSMPVYRALMLPEESLKGLTREDVRQDKDGKFPVLTQRLPDLKLLRNGAASTAFGDEGRSVANSWQGVGKLPKDSKRIVLRIDAPRESILSIPVFGQNVHDEQEVVVAGTAWKKWDAFLDRAPAIEDVPIK